MTQNVVWQGKEPSEKLQLVVAGLCRELAGDSLLRVSGGAAEEIPFNMLKTCLGCLVDINMTQEIWRFGISFPVFLRKRENYATSVVVGKVKFCGKLPLNNDS